MAAMRAGEQQLRVLRLLWAALLFSTVLMLVITYVAISGRGEALTPAPLLLPVLGVVAVLEANASVLVPKHLFAHSVKAAKLEVTELPVKERMFNESARRGRKFTDAKAARERMLPVAQTTFILGMAFAESVALFGLVLYFLGHPLEVALPFFFVCWALMFSKFPNLKKFERQLEGAYDADLA